MKLKRLDPVLVVALAIAALMILFPPWYKRSVLGEFIGFRPLFSPPVYDTGRSYRPQRLPSTASLQERIAESRAVHELRYPTGRIGFGVLATELLSLAVLTVTIALLRRDRREP